LGVNEIFFESSTVLVDSRFWVVDVRDVRKLKISKLRTFHPNFSQAKVRSVCPSPGSICRRGDWRTRRSTRSTSMLAERSQPSGDRRCDTYENEIRIALHGWIQSTSGEGVSGPCVKFCVSVRALSRSRKSDPGQTSQAGVEQFHLSEVEQGTRSRLNEPVEDRRRMSRDQGYLAENSVSKVGGDGAGQTTDVLPHNRE